MRNITRRSSKRRRCCGRSITACTSTLRDCYDSGDPAATVLDRGEGRIFEIAQQKTSNQAVPLTDVLHETFEMLDRQTGEHFSGVTSGFIGLG